MKFIYIMGTYFTNLRFPPPPKKSPSFSTRFFSPFREMLYSGHTKFFAVRSELFTCVAFHLVVLGMRHPVWLVVGGWGGGGAKG
jgi:hypothetical protein